MAIDNAWGLLPFSVLLAPTQAVSGQGNALGLVLLPQAGVAVGMVLLVNQRFPELKAAVLPVVLGSTVVFELLGPAITRRAFLRMGQTGKA